MQSIENIAWSTRHATNGLITRWSNWHLCTPLRENTLCGKPIPRAIHVTNKPDSRITGLNCRECERLNPHKPQALCACGCGGIAPIAQRNNSAYGHVRGQSVRFIVGHFSKTEAHREQMGKIDPARTIHRGEENGSWKGGRWVDPAGYVNVNLGGRIRREHRVIAEKTLGRPLLDGEVVHHINGVKSDNRPENLQVLPSQSEHVRMHMTPDVARERGLKTKRSRAALLAILSEKESI